MAAFVLYEEEVDRDGLGGAGVRQLELVRRQRTGRQPTEARSPELEAVVVAGRRSTRNR